MKNTENSSPRTVRPKLKSQNLLKEPSSEICKLTNPEVQALIHLFPHGTVFRPFDFSVTSDSVSNKWAMPMVWRTLWTIERLVEEESLDFDIGALSFLYTLVTHGSSRFVFKSKPYQPQPILKTTQNDSSWKNQFFFVKRSSIPGGKSLPTHWILRVTKFADLGNDPKSNLQAEVLLSLDPKRRTFQAQQFPEEICSSSAIMSSVQKSAPKSTRKELARFHLNDVDSLLSSRSGKRPATSNLATDLKPLSARTKSAAKKRKTTEPEDPTAKAERRIIELISQEMANVRGHYAKSSASLEKDNVGLRVSLAAKDKEISKLCKDLDDAQETLINTQSGVKEQLAEVMEQAKIWAGKAVLEARIKMAEEAKDPDFDKAGWTIDEWKKTLAGMGGLSFVFGL